MRKLLSLITFVSLAGCGPALEPDAIPECLKLRLQEGGFASSLPARVSLFFSVDTCAGEPVGGLGADSFELFENDVPVSRFESQQQIRSRGEKLRLYSLVLLDLSGSMLRSGDYPKLRSAADAYLDRLLAADPQAHRVGIAVFDGRQELTHIVPFTSDRAALAAGLDALEVRECSASADCAGFADRRTCAGWRCVDDSTNLNGAVIAGLDAVDAALMAAQDIPHRQGALVVFTDGTDQAARVSHDAAEEAVEGGSAHVYTVGFGGEIDPSALQDLGKSGFFSADNAEALSVAFGQVADRLTAIARRYYVLEYCSPKRSGKHSLEVRATLPREHGPALTGTFATDFDATGFESGCSLEAL